jgi:DNA-binding transcriptional ArsR family regulator
MTALRPQEREILRVLYRESPLSYSEIQARVPNALSIHFGWLQNQGLIAEAEPRSKVQRYRLTTIGRQAAKS